MGLNGPKSNPLNYPTLLWCALLTGISWRRFRPRSLKLFILLLELKSLASLLQDLANLR
jgi:hypothetical protein